MIRLRIYLIVLFLFCKGTHTFAQKEILPNTLLWRISGNGLAKPSYLYGTMHLQDKRLFNFGDSVYKGIESVEGFAMEIDFKEYLDSMFLTGIRKATDEQLSQQKIKIDKKLLNKPAEALFKKFDIDKNNVTKKDLKKIRDYRLSKVLQQGEMPTIVDGYLFGLALRQKKFLGAVEDVSDQINLSDELGSELTPENVLQADETMNKGIEELIRIYTNQDLQSIEKMNGGYDASYKDALLTRRNVKMARRMDSLTLVRTMFFAIGAAHLPGDSGVISLLKRRGFSVEPVFSSKKIPASDYARTLAEIPWYTVHDESKLYSVDMPGNPSEFGEFGEAMKMKMFFDLTSMTFYFTGQTIGSYKTEKDFENAFELISKRMGSDEKIISKSIPRTDMHGREATFKKDGVSFRLQLIQKNKSVFMLMAGSSSKESMQTKDISHFFSSFVAHTPPVIKPESIKFTLPEKAFSLMLPGMPKKNESLNRQDSNAIWKFTSYDFIDNTKGLYYLIQVRDLKEGLYLTSDTSYFNSYINETKVKMKTVSREGLGIYKDFPALHFDGQFGANVFYKTFHVLRGSRVYLLAIGGPTESFDDEAENFFNSLVLEEYKKVEWKEQAEQGFSTFAPFGFSKKDASEEDNTETGRQHFLCFNENETVSYNVLKDILPEYYWVNNDSLFFAQRLGSYKGEEDTIISQKNSYTGNLKTVEAIIRKPNSHNLVHIKLLVNGDTLYSILSFVPAAYIDRDNHRNFFNRFKISNEVLPTIYTSKAAKLFEALQSLDSVTFEKALDALYTTDFGVEDLPLLQKAMLQPYDDSVTSHVVRGSLVRHFVEAGDAGTPSFIARNYSHVTDLNLRLSLLEVLARTHNKPSYDTLKKLLLSDLSRNVAVGSLESYLDDSLLLSVRFFPEILDLSSNIHIANLLVNLNNALLDSGLVDFKEIKMHQHNYLSFAKAHIAFLKENTEDWWKYLDWISFIARFNDKETNAVLQGFLTVPLVNIKMHAIIALLKNGQPVSANEVLKVASDKSIRSYFYSELVKIKSEHIFPAAYSTQQSLAESDMHGTASDEDYEIVSQSFLGEKIVKYKGSLQRFYLFKITYDIDDGKKETYLGVCGPYELKSKLPIPFADLTGLYWEEEFSKALLEKQFKAYMMQVEE